MFKKLNFGRRAKPRPKRMMYCPRIEHLEDRRYLCGYDLNSDGMVSVGDLLPMVEELRTHIATGDTTLRNADTDINGDGHADLEDLIVLVADIRAHDGLPYAVQCSAGISVQEALANPATGTAVNLVDEMIVDAFSVVSLTSNPSIIKQFYVEIVQGNGDEIFHAIDVWGDLNGDNLPEYIASGTADGDGDNNLLTFTIQVTEFLDPAQVRDFQIRALPDVKGESRQIQFSLVGITAYEYDGTLITIDVGHQPQTWWTIIDATPSISIQEAPANPVTGEARNLTDEMLVDAFTMVNVGSDPLIIKQIYAKIDIGDGSEIFPVIDVYGHLNDDGIPDYIASASADDDEDNNPLTFTIQVTEFLDLTQVRDFEIRTLPDVKATSRLIRFSLVGITAYTYSGVLVNVGVTNQAQTLWAIID